MPTTLQVPWDEIKILFAQGLSPDVLGQRFGVKPGSIYKRAYRHGWRGTKAIQAKTIEAATQRIIAKRVEQAAPIVDKAIDAWVKKSQAVAGKIVDRVSDKLSEPTTPDGLLKLAGALERADGVGRKAMGMENGNVSGPLHLTVGLQFVGNNHLQSDTTDIVTIDCNPSESSSVSQ